MRFNTILNYKIIAHNISFIQKWRAFYKKIQHFLNSHSSGPIYASCSMIIFNLRLTVIIIWIPKNGWKSVLLLLPLFLLSKLHTFQTLNDNHPINIIRIFLLYKNKRCYKYSLLLNASYRSTSLQAWFISQNRYFFLFMWQIF